MRRRLGIGGAAAIPSFLEPGAIALKGRLQLPHPVVDEFVRALDCAARVVDEGGLHVGPADIRRTKETLLEGSRQR